MRNADILNLYPVSSMPNAAWLGKSPMPVAPFAAFFDVYVALCSAPFANSSQMRGVNRRVPLALSRKCLILKVKDVLA
jgi:hypothetical protein